MKRLLPPALLLVLFVAGPSLAKDLHVPKDFAAIQKAVDAASDGDVVRVAAGSYKECVKMKSRVTLWGAGATKTKIQSADGYTASVSLHNLQGAWVDGFTITTGKGGRGLDALSASFTISNCIVEGNSEGISQNACYMTVLLNNTFRKNSNNVRLLGSCPTVARNRILAEGFSMFGVFLSGASPYITQNVLSGHAFGIAASGKCMPIVRNNVIHRCRMSGIQAKDEVVLSVRNNIFSHISQGIALENASAAISHNNFFEVKSPYLSPKPFRPRPGTGELAADPLFQEPAKGDFRLKEDSPCIGAGVKRMLEAAGPSPSMGLYPDGKEVPIGHSEDEAFRKTCGPKGGELLVNHVDEEYLYISQQRCSCGGGFQVKGQRLKKGKTTSYDVLTAVCRKCRQKKSFRFDVGRFFGEMFVGMKGK
jgi:parallel beta-helix repeat protein